MTQQDNAFIGSANSGSGGLSYQTGLDYSGLADLDASIGIMPSQVLPGEDGSQNMGAFSQDVPLMSDMDSQVGDVDLFDDPEPTDNNQSQWDSDMGVPVDKHTEILSQEQVYGSQVEPVFSEIPETSNPLINRG